MVAPAPSKSQRPMGMVVEGLTTKSDKIRALFLEGYSRSEIAKYLDIRYQHVRNVLVQDGHTKTRLEQPAASRGSTDIEPTEVPSSVRATVGPGGRIVIPAPYRQVLGLDDGTPVVIRLDGDDIRVTSHATAIRRVQEMIREYVPDDVSLVDELIAERRREAALEEGHE